MKNANEFQSLEKLDQHDLIPEYNITYTNLLEKLISIFQAKKIGVLFLMLFPFVDVLHLHAGISIGIAIIISCFILISLQKKNFCWLRYPWIKTGFLLWIYLIIQSFFTIDPLLAFKKSFCFGFLFFFTLSITFFLRDKKIEKFFIFAILLAILITVSYGLIQFFTGHALLHQNFDIPSFFERIKNPSGDFTHLRTITGENEAGKNILAIGALPIFSWLLSEASNKNNCLKKRISFFILVGIIYSFIIISGDRAAELLTTAGLFLLLIFLKPIRRILILLFISSFILLSVFMLHDKSLYKRTIVSIKPVCFAFLKPPTHLQTNQQDSSRGYAFLAKKNLEIFISHPFFGIGIAQAHAYHQIHKDGVVHVDAISLYLEWLSQTGLIGTILFFTLVFFWIKEFHEHKKTIFTSPIATGAFVSIIIYLFPLGTGGCFAITSVFGNLFWWMGGWIFAYIEREISTQENKNHPL